MTADISGIVDMVISYAPTLLFLLVAGIATLIGLLRGFRKSLILGIQAAASFIICLIVFLICVNTPIVDEAIVNIVNHFMGEGGLQNSLNVSVENETLTAILIEYIPTVLDYGEGMNAVVLENGAYLATLVNFVYRLVFAIILSIVHVNLVILLYIVYFFAYPERRYKRRHKKTYTKKRLLGMAVGASRGLVAATLMLSFMGSGLYTLSGGKGEGTLEEHTFDDHVVQEVYDSYRSIEEYGTTGIFKVLNAFSNKEGTPYYLFAADLIFSGGLEDENQQINENISFREETAAYTGFAKDTLNLMMKYGGEEVDKLLANPESVDMDSVIQIMSQEDFQAEFDELILSFDAKTYFVNLTFSLVTSIINHIDELSFASSIPEDALELVKLLFKKDYLSDYIPEEKALKEADENAINDAACLKVNHLLEREDVLVVYKMLLSILTPEEEEVITASTDEPIVEEEGNEGGINLTETLGYVKKALPYLGQLSILQDKRKEELEPVLSRLYCFIENKHLTPVGFDQITHQEIKDANIHWIDEINSLIGLADEVIDLYINNYQEGQEMLDMAVSIFDKTNEHYDSNISCYENICDLIATSKMLGKIVSSGKITDLLVTEIKNLNEYTYISENIQFENTYDSEGNVSQYGELYYIFNGLKLIGTKGDAELVNSLLPKEGEEGFNFDAVKSLAEIITEKDENGYSVADYLIESDLFHSVVSAFMVEQSHSSELSLYVPETSLLEDKEGNKVNLVNKEELKEVLNHLPELVDTITPLIEGEGGIEDLEDMAKTTAIKELLEINNPIIEGTFSKVLFEVMSNTSMIVIPNHLQTIDSWFLYEEHGELNKMVDFINGSNIRLMDMANSENKLSVISKLDDDSINLMFESEILHYTVSNVLLTGTNSSEFKIIIPYVCREPLQDDAIEYLVKKEDIKSMFKAVLELDIGSEISYAALLSNLAKNKEDILSNLIIKTSIINLISNNESLVNMLSMPYKFIKNGHEEYLLEYQTTNIWETELNSLIDCLNEMFDLSSKDESFTLDENAINEVLTTIFTRLNEPTKTNAEKTLLKMCYDSEIVLNKLTLEIDNVLLNQNMITADEANKVKDSSGYYTYQELQAFTNSIEVFDIGDVLNANSDDLTSKITDSVFKLNEYREEEKFSGLRTIDVIYDSYLVMYIFSDKLDTSIVDLIKENVLAQIKDNKKVYPKDELVSLVDAINELEITSLDNLSNFDFNNISSFNNTSITDNSKTKLNVIYKSLLVGGIMTKTINDITLKPDAFLVDHPLAYQTDIEIYKENEISSLIDILDGVNVDSFELADVNLSLVKDAIYYEPTNATSSYILVATISKELSAHNGVVIPLRTIDENVTTSNVIKPLELHKLLTSCELLMGNDDLSTWTIDTSAISLPAAAVREQVSESEIVRASITEMIAATNQDDEDLEVWVNKEHCEMVKDVNNNDIVVVDKEEMIDMFNALEILDDGTGKQFIIPSFTITSIIKYASHMDVLYECDAVKYRVCDVLLATPVFTPTNAFEEVSYNLHNKQEVVKQVVEYDEIETFLSAY